ncbi:MAG: hypothetical protein LBJ63_08935 [Prevotellaceae bacterium]|jgi:hypothetical protein|nr:hypothetical protein [Prevotellaceae bacterium]
MKQLQNISAILMALFSIFLIIFKDIVVIPAFISLSILSIFLILFVISIVFKSVNKYKIPFGYKISSFLYYNYAEIIEYCYCIYFLLFVFLYIFDISFSKFLIGGFWFVLGAYLSSLISLKLYNLKKNDENKDTVKK